MKRTIILSVLVILSTSFSVPCVAQGTASSIQGHTFDADDQQPLPFTTIELLNTDSTLVTGAIANEEGRFVLQAPSGKYILKVTYMGYQPTCQELHTVNGTLDLGSLFLHEDVHTLGDVVIEGQLPRTQLKGDAVVTTIEESVLAHVGNALDVMAKVPGIITRDGNLEVLGRGTPVYYLNGRKVTDTSELRNLMSEDIKSIDVVSNPGAAYGGEVTCVVRIRTVKRQGDGFSFALTSQAKQHIYECHDTEPSWTVLDLNYRKGGWDFFGKLVYWNQRGYQISDIYGGTHVMHDGKIVSNMQQGLLDYRGNSGGFQYVAGANWQINENHSLGFKLDRSLNLIADSHLKMDVDVFTDGVQIDHVYSVNDADNFSPSLSGNLYYDGNWDAWNINFNADFMNNLSSTMTDVHETGWTAPVELKSTMESTVQMGAGKLIVSRALGVGKLQIGTEETWVSGGQTYAITPIDIPATNASLTENTIAGFAEYAAMLPFGQLNAGLRYEHANFNYADHLDESNNLNRRHNNWFPSLNFATQAGPVGLSLSYTGKTIRPNYSYLSSEITYDNRFTYQSGDPLLKNEIMRTLSLNANWKWLTLSGNYIHVENAFYQKGYPYNAEGVAMIKFANTDDPVNKLSFYLNGSPKVGIWYPRITVGMEKQYFTTTVIDPRVEGGMRQVSLNRPMYLVQADNSLRFKKGWVLEANYQYMSPCNQEIMLIEKPIHCASMAVSKSFLKNDALSFRLSAEDIFNCSVYYFVTDYGNCEIRQSNDGYKPCIQLRASYRFNSADSKYKGNGAGQSVKERM